MRKVLLFSALLVTGLVVSQLLPRVMSGDSAAAFGDYVRFFTMLALAFTMIHVGYEFDLDKTRLRSYGWDYVVAMTAAAFPWIFVTAYFVFVMTTPESWGSWQIWKESLLAGRFAAPTSAGVLFAMLAAAGLSGSWVFKKARILAIFDDLDTVLLMIPLKMLIVGLAWQLGMIAVFMGLLLWVAWRWLHRIQIPISWPWVIGYSTAISAGSEVIYRASKFLDDTVPIHIEVLLPAFVLGCVMARPHGSDPHLDDLREGHQEGPESPVEQKVATLVSAVFMVLVGLNMPPLLPELAGGSSSGEARWGAIVFHVLAVTVVSNLGKMFPALNYRTEVPWRERLALAIGMWPRGEVGAGVLVISLSYGISGPILTVATLSLALNLALTGLFITIVKKLVSVE